MKQVHQQAHKKAQQQIRIILATQRLQLIVDDQVLVQYTISTSKHGAGELTGSYKTPRGRHVIRAMIGRDAPLNTVFRGRRPTGEIATPEVIRRYPGRDWVLSRILWLSGTEPGFNRLGDVDTMRRLIYIHGCSDDAPVGVARSIGCIRMTNKDVVDLFERVNIGDVVYITEQVNSG